jgi:hypothetical protein
MTDLFVLEEINNRGDVSQNKFKVQLPLIQQAVDYALMSQDDRDEIEQEIDEFLDSFENYSLTTLLASIIGASSFIPNFDPNSVMDELKEKGRFGVESEEQIYGVGTTKELAYQAFSEIQTTCEDDGWE